MDLNVIQIAPVSRKYPHDTFYQEHYMDGRSDQGKKQCIRMHTIAEEAKTI